MGVVANVASVHPSLEDAQLRGSQYSNNCNIVGCAPPCQIAAAMFAWTMRVVRLTGEQLEIEFAAGCKLWEVMKIVKHEWGVPKHEHVYCIDTRVLRPFDRLGDGDVCVTLVRRPWLCAHCSQPSRSWCECRTERYCSRECQRAHWVVHRPVCREIMKQ